MRAIMPVKIQVALKGSGERSTFTFLRTWKVPRLLMEFSAGQIALTNVTLLFADDETACKDFLLDLPVLRTLGIDSRTLLENNCSTLNVTDCYNVVNKYRKRPSGNIGRFLISLLQGLGREHEIKHDKQTPRPNCFANQQDTEPFPDPLLIQPENYEDDDRHRSDISEMTNRAK